MVKIIDNEKERKYSIGDTFVDTDDGDEYMLVGTDEDEVVIVTTSGDYIGKILGHKYKVDDINSITYAELDDMSNCNACDMKLTSDRSTGFKPVSFVIETEGELKELLCRLNVTSSAVDDYIIINDYESSYSNVSSMFDCIKSECVKRGLYRS